MNQPNDNRALETHIICTVRSKPEHRERVKQLLLELVEPARNENGCLYYDLYQDANAPDTFILLDGSASKEALAMHVVRPNVPRVVDQMLPLLSHPIANTYTTRVSKNKGGQNESTVEVTAPSEGIRAFRNNASDDRTDRIMHRHGSHLHHR